MDELGERKEKILNAIIQNYLETGEPVGSRTISKMSDLNLSSATIRNEMSDLEELGYIVQPHTSSGRIPSDKGYRFYVDQGSGSDRDEGSDDRKDGEDGTTLKTGRQGTCQQYAVRHDDICTECPAQPSQVRTVICRR